MSRAARAALVGAFVLALAGGAGVAGRAGAASAPPVQRWSGNFDQDGGDVSTDGTPRLSGVVTYNYQPVPFDPTPAPAIDSMEVSVAPAGILPDGCDVPDAEAVEYTEIDPAPESPDPDQLDPLFNETVSFDASDISFTCNGSYVATLHAVAGQSTFDMSLGVGIAVAPLAPTGLTAADGGSGGVDLAWSPAYTGDAAPADFLGYRLERASGDGPFETVIDLDPTTTAYVDHPGTTGAVDYRVRSLRYGATGAGDPAVSGPSDAATVTVTSPATTTTTYPPLAGGLVTGTHTPPTLPSATTATTTDPGFQQALDYGTGSGEANAAGTDEYTDGSVVQRFVDSDGRQRTLVIPIAAALVLLGWAVHIRYITRQAAMSAGAGAFEHQP